MRYARYQVIVKNEHQMYEFCSEGQRGCIQKAVIYTRIQGNLYNLAFGDWNESIQKLDDSIRSNNGDKDKVLATVAFTALTFTDQYPKAKVFVEGSTAAKTRLYQMGINNNLLEISLNFNVKGYHEGCWTPFHQGRNYKAFLIQRK